MKNENLSSNERSQLQGARNHIGDYNDPNNKVVIKFGAAPKAASGYVDAKGNLVLDENKNTRTAAQGSAATAAENTENALARTIVHESDHALRYANREAWSITRMKLEVEGYRAAAIYQKAAGWLDLGTNAWTRITGTIDENVLRGQAKFSIISSCGSATGCD